MLCLGLLPFFCHISLFLTLSLFSSFSFCSLSPSLYNGFCLSSSLFLLLYLFPTLSAPHSFSLLFPLYFPVSCSFSYLFPLLHSSSWVFYVIVISPYHLSFPFVLRTNWFSFFSFPFHVFLSQLINWRVPPSVSLSLQRRVVCFRSPFFLTLCFLTFLFPSLLFICCSQYSGNIMPIINLILSFYFLHLRKMWCYILHISYPIPEQLPSSPKNSQNQTKRLCLKFVLYSVLYSLPGVSESNGERGACHLALRNTCLTCEYVCEIWLFFFLLLTNI